MHLWHFFTPLITLLITQLITHCAIIEHFGPIERPLFGCFICSATRTSDSKITSTRPIQFSGTHSRGQVSGTNVWFSGPSVMCNVPCLGFERMKKNSLEEQKVQIANSRLSDTGFVLWAIFVQGFCWCPSSYCWGFQVKWVFFLLRWNNFPGFWVVEFDILIFKGVCIKICQHALCVDLFGLKEKNCVGWKGNWLQKLLMLSTIKNILKPYLKFCCKYVFCKWPFCTCLDCFVSHSVPKS